MASIGSLLLCAYGDAKDEFWVGYNNDESDDDDLGNGGGGGVCDIGAGLDVVMVESYLHVSPWCLRMLADEH